MKPTIVVTAAAGHTGATTTTALLRRGFPVRALVRQADARAGRLQRAGAEVLVVDLNDPRHLEAALKGARRAYHCVPFAPGTLHQSALFALAAEACALEAMVVLTPWNPHPTHPSIHQREHWIADELRRWLPGVGVVNVTPGLFAFPYFFGLASAVHLGRLLLPFGDGRNAPPSNEDIGEVIAAILADPDPHLGRRYRPTGPALIDGHDAAAAIARLLDRPVRYRPISVRMFTKAARVFGLGTFEIAQIRHYARELQGGTYAIGAPTDHVQQITGRPAEPFEVTARRYLEHPDRIMPGLRAGTRTGAVLQLLRIALTPAPDLERWEARRDDPRIDAAQLAHESAAWRRSVMPGTPTGNGPAPLHT